MGQNKVVVHTQFPIVSTMYLPRSTQNALEYCQHPNAQNTVKQVGSIYLKCSSSCALQMPWGCITLPKRFTRFLGSCQTKQRDFCEDVRDFY